jgi:hypothetical protein
VVFSKQGKEVKKSERGMSAFEASVQAAAYCATVTGSVSDASSRSVKQRSPRF